MAKTIQEQHDTEVNYFASEVGSLFGWTCAFVFAGLADCMIAFVCLSVSSILIEGMIKRYLKWNKYDSIAYSTCSKKDPLFPTEHPTIYSEVHDEP